jgi:hypothetical protein
MKINLASGRDYREGYLNVDNLSMRTWQVDIKADVFEFDTKDKFEEILLSHFAMYIPQPQMLPLLKRWHGWLTDGGRIIIETGDVKKIAKTILESKNTDEEVKNLFGWGETVGSKWSWCPETLKPLLEEAGFRDIEARDGKYHGKPERDFIITGTK